MMMILVPDLVLLRRSRGAFAVVSFAFFNPKPLASLE